MGWFLLVFATIFQGNILGDVWSKFSGGIGNIKDALWSILSPVVSELWDWINWGLHRIEEVVGYFTGLLSLVEDWAVHQFWDVQNWTVGLIHDAQRWAGDLIDKLSRRVDGLAEIAGRGVGGLLQDAKDYALRLINDVKGWVTGAIDAAVDFVVLLIRDNLYRPLTQWIKDRVDELTGGLGEVHDLVFGIRNWIRDEALPAIQLVGRVAKFLLFVAEHPFDWWLTELRAQADRGARPIMDNITGILQREGKRLEDWIVRWLS